MRKKRYCILAVLMALQPFAALSTAADTDQGALYYTDYAVSNWFKSDSVVETVTPDEIMLNGQSVGGGSVTVSCDDGLSFDFTPQNSGEYGIILSYRLTEEPVSLDTLIDVSVNGAEPDLTQLQLFWYDCERGKVDRQGDDISPEQACLSEFAETPLLVYSDTTRDSACWQCDAGSTYTFYLAPTIQPIEISYIRIFEIGEPDVYSNAENTACDAETVIIEGENYSLKSDSFIRSASVRNAAISPYDTYKQRLNVLDGSSWDTTGQKVLWEFETEEDGYYCISLHIKQNNEANKSVFRRIEIDGEVPFAEWENAQIAYTSASGYKNVTLKANGNDALVYLEKGVHTIAMTVTAGEYEKIYNDIYALMSEIDDLGLALLKLTAGATDENRTWDMQAYMPDAVDRIENYADRADAIYGELAEIEGCEPVYAIDLESVSEKLRDLLKEPEKIPNKTEDIFRGDTSASKYLGNILSKLSSHGMSVDRIYIHGNKELPEEKAGLFVSIWESIKRFVWSFLPSAVKDYNISEKNSEELTVWVGQSSIITDILQQIVDEDYNSKAATDIRLVVMPSEQKLVLANAAGANPDVVIAAPSGLAFTFASRNALKNLLDYDGFLTFYNSEYILESLVSTSYCDGVYGAVDSKNFKLLFYRKDILSSLNLTVPDTWDDVRRMIPTLLRNQMNFYIPISSSASLKGLDTTSPFIFQNGGEIYSTDGITTDINSPESINAITEMTEFYRIYGMQTTVSSFYNSFRYGEVPIGIGDFNMYMQLSMAAPELAGQWGVALSPGTEREDGTVVRYQPANQTASFIFKNTDKQEEAWSFLRWWLSSETQLEFSVRRSSTFGPEYQWNTANMKAFEQLPFDNNIKELALSQWEQQREVTPHPASYIVERELSGVWNDVVIDNTPLIESLDKAVLATNREFQRKLQEFGYIDFQGNLIKEYNVKIIEMLYEKLDEEAGQYEE